MSKCDLCGKSCSSSDLSQLRDIYKITGISDICPKCDRWVNRQLNAIRDGIAPTLRQKIGERAGRKAFNWWGLLRSPAVLPDHRED